MFKLQSLSKYSPFDAIHLSRCFFHCSKQFLNSSILMPFSSAVFLFHLFHISKMFPFKDFFHLGKQTNKNVTQGKIGWIGRMKYGGHAIFGQKLRNIQCGVGRWARKSPIMKWANALSLQKNSLKLNAASHNNTSKYTDTDGLLKQLPSWGNLYYKGPAHQKIIPVLWGFLHIVMCATSFLFFKKIFFIYF